jgi:hypothetical protein
VNTNPGGGDAEAARDAQMASRLSRRRKPSSYKWSDGQQQNFVVEFLIY